MSKKDNQIQPQKNTNTDNEKPDNSVKIAIISGIVTIVVAIISALIAPVVLEKMKESSPPTSQILSSSTPLVETPFTGIWKGTDPSDGSITTLSLVQTGNILTWSYNDSYSGKINPPGWHGEGTGIIDSSTTAHIVFNVLRWDGEVGIWDVHFTLANDNNSIMIDNCLWQGKNDTAGCPIVLYRQ